MALLSWRGALWRYLVERHGAYRVRRHLMWLLRLVRRAEAA